MPNFNVKIDINSFFVFNFYLLTIDFNIEYFTLASHNDNKHTLSKVSYFKTHNASFSFRFEGILR